MNFSNNFNTNLDIFSPNTGRKRLSFIFSMIFPCNFAKRQKKNVKTSKCQNIEIVKNRLTTNVKIVFVKVKIFEEKFK